MIDIENEAERQLDRPHTTTLTEAFEAGANWILDNIKREFECIRYDIKDYLNDCDVDEDIFNGVEVALNDFKERLDEYV